MKEKEKHKQIKVVHIMADGSVRDSVEGYPVPVNDITKPAYNILAAMAIRSAASTSNFGKGRYVFRKCKNRLSLITKEEA